MFTINICNKSTLAGIFPDLLKFPIINPIHKKGGKMNPTNYRSLSLLIFFFKVFEKALYTRLTEHFNSNKLLVGNHFSYRKGIATEDIIFKLTT